MTEREIIRRNLPWAFLAGIVLQTVTGSAMVGVASFASYLFFAWLDKD